MRSLIQDISFSLRLLRRHPLETALAVAALALGVGLSTAMFSILWGTVLRGLPYKDADRLVRIETISQGERVTPTDVDFLAWRRNQHSFDDLAAFLGGSFNLSSAGEPAARYNGSYVSANIFRIVQIHPLLGRDFQEADEAPGAPLVTIISEGLWKKQFNRDPNIIGKLINLNSQPAQVVGVMPGDFGFPLHQEIWVPLQLDPKPSRPGRIQVLGKSKIGFSKRQAAADLQVSSPQRLEKTVQGVRVTPYVSAYTEDLQPSLYLLLYASLGLLLIVCANIAGLLTAQAITRLPELAIRSAVGATRSRLLAQLITEAAVLTVAGFLLSLPLTLVTIRAYVASQGGQLRSFWMDVRPDGAAFAYSLSITVAVSVLSSVFPALRVTGRRLSEVLKRGAGKGTTAAPGAGSWLRLIAQFALSFALLVATELLIGSLGNMARLNSGHAPAEVLMAQLYAPATTYTTPESKVRFFEALRSRIEEAVGPGRVAFSSNRPGTEAEEADLEIEGQPSTTGTRPQTVPFLIASRQYFQVLGVDPLQGRVFDTSDRAEGEPVAVVNQSFVRHYFGDRPPLGARLRLNGSRWRTIIGVVPDLVMSAASLHHPEGVYVSLTQAPTGWMAVLIRIPGNPATFIKPLSRIVASVDSEIPVFGVATLQKDLIDTRLELQTLGNIFFVFGAAALFLSLLGVYGVTSQSVASRSRDMAIRLTLGAQKNDLLRLVAQSSLLQVIFGILAGVLLSLGTSQFIEFLLFGVRARDLSAFLSVFFLIFFAGLTACLFPALKILKVEPAETLRGE